MRSHPQRDLLSQACTLRPLVLLIHKLDFSISTQLRCFLYKVMHKCLHPTFLIFSSFFPHGVTVFPVSFWLCHFVYRFYGQVPISLCQSDKPEEKIIQSFSMQGHIKRGVSVCTDCHLKPVRPKELLTNAIQIAFAADGTVYTPTHTCSHSSDAHATQSLYLKSLLILSALPVLLFLSEYAPLPSRPPPSLLRFPYNLSAISSEPTLLAVAS